VVSFHSSVRPLPKMPVLHEIPKHKHSARLDERSQPPMNVLPRRPADMEEIRRGNLSKLRRHLGYSIPPNLVPPRLDRDGASGALDSNEEDRRDLRTVPMTTVCRSKLTEVIPPILKTANEMDEKTMKRYSRRWLREKKGRRWVEDDYNIIIQRLRAL
jgi:hypothetical protein